MNKGVETNAAGEAADDSELWTEDTHKWQRPWVSREQCESCLRGGRVKVEHLWVLDVNVCSGRHCRRRRLSMVAARW